MWSGFFFYSPRPPSQKNALVFLTMAVVLVNVFYILVLLYLMCSQCCKEHEDDVQVFNQRALSMKQAIGRRGSSINLALTARIDVEKNKYRSRFKISSDFFFGEGDDTLSRERTWSQPNNPVLNTMQDNECAGMQSRPPAPVRRGSEIERIRKDRTKSMNARRKGMGNKNPIYAERKLTTKSSKSELMSLSKELRRAKHRAQEEVKELQRYELELGDMVDQIPDERDDIEVEATEVEIEMVCQSSRSRADRLNQMRTHSTRINDVEGNNPLFLNRLQPALNRNDEGEIKLNGDDGDLKINSVNNPHLGGLRDLKKKNSMKMKSIVQFKKKIKKNRPNPLPSSWMKKKKISRTKM